MHDWNCILVILTVVESLNLFTQFLSRQEPYSPKWSEMLVSSVLNPPTLGSFVTELQFRLAWSVGVILSNLKEIRKVTFVSF